MDPGICPSCEASGPVASPCEAAACVRRRMHRIPLGIWHQLAATRDRGMDPRIGMLLHEYLIVGALGRGGFGTVYLALQQPLGMKTALKLLDARQDDPRRDQQVRKNFEREARTLAALHHPNIVRLMKYGLYGEHPYLVMEYVEGGRTLKQELKSAAQTGALLSPQRAGHVLRQICYALSAAHARQIVHRDVKPENVMLQQVAGDADFVKMLDFGLAKFLEGTAATSVTMGTPVYMAPEQLLQEDVGPWTDCYALAAVAYEMLTGRRAFPGRNSRQVIDQKLDVSYPPQVAAGLPGFARSFFERGLARAVADRFQDVEELRRSLDVMIAAMVEAKLTTLASGEPMGLPTAPTEQTPGRLPGFVGSDGANGADDEVVALPRKRRTFGRPIGWAAAGLGLVGAAAAVALTLGGGAGETDPGSSCAPAPDTCTRRGMALDRAGDAAGAKKTLGDACDAGSARGCYHLGRVLLASGDAADQRAAEAPLGKACAAGRRVACYRLGRVLLEDADRAADGAQLLTKQCDVGHARSCASLADAFADGAGVPVDKRQAAELRAKACEAGYSRACGRKSP